MTAASPEGRQEAAVAPQQPMTMAEAAKATEHMELPDDLRLPLHSLQADLGWLFGRVAADGSVASMCEESARNRLSQIEEACYRILFSSALLAPVAPVAVSVKAKPLEWGEERRVPDAASSETMLRQRIGHHNLGPFAGSYSVQEMESGGAWGWWNSWTAERYPDGVEPTLEAAKAAAQADFNARIHSALIAPAKPAVESICPNCRGKGAEPGYVNDDGPPVDIKCEICGGAKPAVELVEALKKALQPFADVARRYGQRWLDEREANNLPHDYAKAVFASAEQTGWNVWADAIAAIDAALSIPAGDGVPPLRAEICPRCSGTGRDPQTTSLQCWKCRGAGALSPASTSGKG